MLYSQYPSENFQVEISIPSKQLENSDEMNVSHNKFSYTKKLANIDIIKSVSCFVFT